MPRKPYRIAAIDVGTNSVHMIIVESQKRGYRIIDREKEMVQLGRGSLGGAPLTPEAIERGVNALRTMTGIARQWNATDIIAVATSAMREAPNRRVFLREARERADIDVRVISGEEEADYIYRAMRAAVDFRGGTAVFVDIGGGSLEIIVGTEDEVFFTSSEPAGSLRLTQKFFPSDPPMAGQVLACREWVRKRLRKPLAEVRALGFDQCFGSSGTILTLAELIASGAPAGEIASGLRRVSRKDLEALVKRLVAMPVAERVSVLGLEQRRAETIVAGGITLLAVMEMLKIDQMLACTAALREGIVEKILEERELGSERRSNVRRESVLTLLERSQCDRTHAAHVARMALRLYDQTAGIHKLRPADRELLEYAALLHEVGMHVSFERHHQHTYYVIRHAGLRGFTDEQIAVIANVARYYRKTPPDRGHPNFAELSKAQQRVVERLSAILRIADGLDRGRHQAVRDVGVVMEPERVRFELRPRGDVTVELESAARRARYFGRLFDRKVAVELGSGV